MESEVPKGLTPIVQDRTNHLALEEKANRGQIQEVASTFTTPEVERLVNQLSADLLDTYVLILSSDTISAKRLRNATMSNDQATSLLDDMERKKLLQPRIRKFSARQVLKNDFTQAVLAKLKERQQSPQKDSEREEKEESEASEDGSEGEGVSSSSGAEMDTDTDTEVETDV